MITNAKTEIRIEPLSENYIESFHRCLDSVARERKYLAMIEAPPLNSTRRFIMANLSNNVPMFIAVRDEEVVGWCDIIPNNLEGFNHCGRLGMGVIKELRRLGIGQKLVEQTISKARQLDLERIELEVFASNIPAIRLYEKLGFQVEGVKKMARKLDDVIDDNVDMALFLKQKH